MDLLDILNLALSDIFSEREIFVKKVKNSKIFFQKLSKKNFFQVVEKPAQIYIPNLKQFFSRGDYIQIFRRGGWKHWSRCDPAKAKLTPN